MQQLSQTDQILYLKHFVNESAESSSGGLSVVKVLRLSTRWPHSFQQRCGFRKATRKPESKRVEEELGTPHTETSEPVVHRRTSTPHMDQQAPPGSPRAFGRLLRPLVFTMGVGDVHLWVVQVMPSATGVNSMSVYRLLLRLGSHLAVRVPQVSGPDLL